MSRIRIWLSVTTATLFIAASPVHAEQPKGAGGASSQVLGLTDRESTQYFEDEPSPRAGSPNVIYIVLDDMGFSDIGAFGAEIATPNMDSVARDGLKFINFHTQGICSPTRAALLTGRNSHTVGVGTIPGLNNGFPNGQARISPKTGTVAQILRAAGYRTFAAGKWHLAPLMQNSSRANWPLAKGFDQFYGFLDAMSDQYSPELVVDNTVMESPSDPKYHFSEAITTRAIDYIATETAVSPDRPFFLYLAFGAAHSPHQVSRSFVNKYLPMYAAGWDDIRAQRFEKQKRLGVIPADAALPPRDPANKAWTELSQKERDLYTEMQATYAGFVEHTDLQIGRLLSFLDKTGRRDNTLIVILSDNGASGYGHEHGSMNDIRSMSGERDTVEELSAYQGRMGLADTYQIYPRGWGEVGNTPFRFYKGSPWEGGTRTPLIVSWPKWMRDNRTKPGTRAQFVDSIDITPTVLNATGIVQPEMLDGVVQLPIAGTSILPVMATASAPAPRDVQYYEMAGSRALWSGPWKIMAKRSPGTPYTEDQWMLFNLASDPTELHDVAPAHAQRVEEMKSRWWAEAAKYGALPLAEMPVADVFRGKNDPDGSRTSTVFKFDRARRKSYTYYPEGNLFLRKEAPNLTGTSYAISIALKNMEEGDQGVLVASGDRFGGYALFVKASRLTFVQSDLGRFSRVESREISLNGISELRYVFTRSSPKGGEGQLFADGKLLASGPIALSESRLASLSGFDIGIDRGGKVTTEYETFGAFPFTADRIESVTVRPDGSLP